MPLADYERAWDEAVRVFGRNRVSTYLLIGLGENPDDLVRAAKTLIGRGVCPFLVPMRPMAGTLARRAAGQALAARYTWQAAAAARLAVYERFR